MAAPETKHHGRSSGFTVSGRFAVSADYIVWGIPDAVHPDFAEYLPGGTGKRRRVAFGYKIGTGLQFCRLALGDGHHAVVLPSVGNR